MLGHGNWPASQSTKPVYVLCKFGGFYLMHHISTKLVLVIMPDYTYMFIRQCHGTSINVRSRSGYAHGPCGPRWSLARSMGVWGLQHEPNSKLVSRRQRAPIAEFHSPSSLQSFVCVLVQPTQRPHPSQAAPDRFLFPRRPTRRPETQKQPGTSAAQCLWMSADWATITTESAAGLLSLLPRMAAHAETPSPPDVETRASLLCCRVAEETTTSASK
jgi:hypothetical protein